MQDLESTSDNLICGALGCRRPILEEKMVYSPKFNQIYHLRLDCLDIARITEAAIAGEALPKPLGDYQPIDQKEAYALREEGKISLPLELK